MLWCVMKFPLFSIIRGKYGVHTKEVQERLSVLLVHRIPKKEEEGGGPPPGGHSVLFFLGLPLFLLGGSWVAAFSAALAALRVAWSGSSTSTKSTMSL